MRSLSAPSCMLLLLAIASALPAQVPRPFMCRGQRISAIEVETRAPYEANGQRWWSAPIRGVNQMHVTTRPAVVRRYLLQYEGEPCNERLRAESERLLRAQPFIARARIDVVADGQEAVIWRVSTTDELTAFGAIRADAESPWLTGLTLGEGNVGGRAMLISAGWRDGRDRQHWEGRFVHHQFNGHPWLLEIGGARREIGFNEWRVSLSEPFYTDDRRYAWAASVARRNEVFDFYIGEQEPIAVALANEFATFGGLVRIGRPGRSSLIGLALTTEYGRAGAPPAPRQLAPYDYDSLAAPFAGRRSTRVNALWGLRMLDYVQVRRFDAIDGAQDMPRGMQLGVVLGRGLDVIGSRSDDILVATDVYGGYGSERSFLTLHARGEARDDLVRDEWDGILASATLAAYHRMHPRHTLHVQANWSAGWRLQVPFQLPIGSHDGGVRGFDEGRESGGRRAVLTVEDRWYLGAVRGQADLAVAAFVDAGAVRAGDAPYGVDSPVRVGLGVGVLAALPPGSRRTWRLDFAVPLNSDGHARWEVRLSSLNVLRAIWREPPEVTRSREQSAPIGLFSWP